MEISIKDLRAIFEILMRCQVEYSGKEVITIEKNDFYWDISAADLYDPYKEPQNLTLGQLSDDWNELQRIVGEEKEPISYDIKRLGVILKAISVESQSRW